MPTVGHAVMQFVLLVFNPVLCCGTRIAFRGCLSAVELASRVAVGPTG